MDTKDNKVSILEKKLNETIKLLKETYLELVIVKLVLIGVALVNLSYYLSKYINS